MILKQKALRLLLILAVSISLVACSTGKNAQPTLSPPLVNSEMDNNLGLPTPLPTYTAIPAPLGSESNPLTLGIIQKDPSPEQMDALLQLGSQISGALQLVINVRTFDDYLSLELSFQRGELHFAWLQPVEYLLASQKGLVKSILGVNNLGVSAYGVQFLAHRDSNLQSYFDVGNNTATSSPEHALQQFSGMRPCLTNKKSLAGYWLPLAYLAKSNLEWQEPVLTQSYAANIRALYIQGICGFTSTYAISADPRSSSAVITDLPDAIEQLPIIWISPPIIPNRALAVSNTVDVVIQARISEFLLQYARDEAAREVLSTALEYEVSGLLAQSDSAFDMLRDLLNFTDIHLLDLVQ